MPFIKRATQFMFFLAIVLSFSQAQATNVSGSINLNTSWNLAGSPYIVTGTITVAEGKTLTIEPGTEVQFNQYTGMYVDGNLQAVGVPEKPIIFTGSSESNGWWTAIYIRGAGSANIQYCDIAYGGNNSYGGWDGNHSVLKTGSGALTLKNTTIRNSSHEGLGLYAGSSSVTMSDNTFKDNDRYGVKLGINASFDDNTSNFSGNASVDVFVDGGMITGPVIWSLKSAYSLYVSNIITIANSTVEPVTNGSLAVRPGTVVKFGQYIGLYIDGELTAKGTATAPIYFTDYRDDTVGGDANKNENADGPGNNWWTAIFIRNAGTATLENCHLRYGGNNSYGGWGGNNGIYKTGTGDLTMIGCTVSDMYGHGLVVAGSTGNVVLTQSIFTNNTMSGLVMNDGPVTATGCTFSNNGHYGISQEINDSLIYTGNTFAGNGLGGVGVSGGNINKNINWLTSGSPFRITGTITVAEGKTLTIEPGTEVQFNQYTGMYVDGNLQAVGVPEKPIIFTGSSESNGWWTAIYIRGAGSANIQYCDIAYGGNNSYGGWDGNHSVLKTGSGALTLKNTTIRNSSHEGLGLYAGSSSVTMSDNTFKDNDRYGVKLGINASFDDNTSNFSGNASVDVFVDGGMITGPVIWSLKSAYSLYVSNIITIANSTVEPVTNGSLAVRPGTVVKFGQYIGLYIDGELTAKGTATAPIYFTDYRDDTVGGDANKNENADGPGNNWWTAIFIRNAGTATLENCHLRYGGNNSYGGWGGNNGIYKTGTGDLTMIGCTVSDMYGHGLVVAGSTGN
ncbi:MAG: right-handed parallel beta-helix repeat-containing protein, partial [Desulfatirhabdiaceae bacterium]